MSLGFAILAVLGHGPRHGYAVRAALVDLIGAFWPVNQGQVYATLARLTREGLVTVTEPEAPGSRLPARPLYAPSPAGRDALAAWLAAPHARRERGAQGFDDWLAHVAICASRGDRERLRTALETQRQRCASLDRALTAGEGSCPERARRAAREHLAAELSWLDRAERALLRDT
ncbi:MAG: PadR family transcriptional regulator [Deltaproteobacteria bacterium]|nr:PadR family transcriptional regulator [Deltaproteobacteria bacterium]